MTNTFGIAFYNVENFFDVFNASKKYDDDYTPKAPKRWDQSRYELKSKKIAKVIADLTIEQTGNPPSIIGLAEIENDKVLSDLINQPVLKKFNYSFCHYESKDERGIDVALLYRKEFCEIIESESITTPLVDHLGDEDFSRDILYCKIKINHEIIHTFTVHLPSKRDNDVNLQSRKKIVGVLKELCDSIKEKEKNPYICILGDFNEDPNNQLFREDLKTRTIPKLVEKENLFNPFEMMLSENQFSLFHRNEGHLFDQILFSKRFLENDTISYKFSKVFSPFYLQAFTSKQLGQPYRTYIGSRYLGGYSDHYPVFSILKINTEE